MTNQNPASSQPLNSDLLAKLNAHADRSLDRLFTDIDELLSGDLEAEVKPAQSNQSAISPSNYRNDADYRQYDHNYTGSSSDQDRFSPQLTAEIDPPQPAKSKQKHKNRKRLPVWLMILSSLGAASIAAGGLLYWLVNERKVTLPQNIDTSWVPFQSKPQVSAADAKFAEYMQKSIAKIEATNLAAANPAATATIAQPNPANILTAPYQPAPTQAAPTQTGQIAATTPKAAASKPLLTSSKPIALVKIAQANGKINAIFQVDKKNQAVKIGQKIGASNWSLINVSKTEVTIKRTGGEIRSIKIGQKF
jgi:Tfp pilus assembly protein PilP